MEEGSPLKSPCIPSPLPGAQCVVVYDFIGESELELSVSKGEIVTLVCSHDQEGSDEWWLVTTPTNQQGYVPSVFLNLMDTT